uniref:Predicted protein n=1 Tax=Hordeum vulgare subsp. vulgare TaxID=112509 RepID=F2EL43_HORVV|nr:predicted protein [Hordeum vulgare subsp. vulgare]
MYPTAAGGEYRLLLSGFDDGDQLAMYVFTIGSAQPPRRIPSPIGCPEPPDRPGFLFKGSLYRHTGSEIVVFDTTNESFRHIRFPYFPGCTAQLFETGGMLGIFDYRDQKTSMYIFAMQNQQSEQWNFESFVRLSVAETRQHCQCPDHRESVTVVPRDGGLLILLKCGAWLFQVDGDGGVIVHGKLIASFRYSDITMSSHYLLKQTLVQHTFFPTLEGYVANALPFI